MARPDSHRGGVLFGVYLVVPGVLQLAAAFGTHAQTSLRVLAFLSGALSVALGLFCIRSVLDSIFLLALWIGIGWLIRGSMLVVAAVSNMAMPGRVWQSFFGLALVLGVVEAISGSRYATT